MTRSPVMRIMRGLPASGKTTKSLYWVSLDPEWRVRVSRDDIRMAQKAEDVYNIMRESNITLLHDAMIDTALKAGLSVVVDNLNLRSSYVRDLYKIANKYNATVEFHDVTTDVEECVTRDKNREFPVGEEVIRDFANRYIRKGQLPEPPVNEPEARESDKAYVPNPNLPKAVWLDADGTFFSMFTDGVPHRGPFEWDKVHMDHPIEAVVDTVKALQKDGYKIIVMSGRDEVCFDDTRDAFIKHGVVPDAVFMRPKGSMEKDWKIKRDLFWTHVAPNYDVRFALDDRQQVVDYTRNVLKIPVFQVAPGDF